MVCRRESWIVAGVHDRSSIDDRIRAVREWVGQHYAGRRSQLQVPIYQAGTFTVIVVMSGDGNPCTRARCRPRRPIRAARWCRVSSAAEGARHSARIVEEVLHGTTVGSNTILQRSGPDRADHHARFPRRAGDRPHPHARHVRPHLGQAKPLVPRGIGWRSSSASPQTAASVEPLNEASVIAAGEQLVAARHRGGRHLPDQQLPQSESRAACRGDSA
jgi:hypothetical protein